MTLEEKVSRRVRRGAVYLDTMQKEWWNKINIDLLDMSSANFDVFGQLFGSFATGNQVLHLADNDHYGFDAAWEDNFYDVNDIEREWTALTRAWQKEVLDRRGADHILVG